MSQQCFKRCVMELLNIAMINGNSLKYKESQLMYIK